MNETVKAGGHKINSVAFREALIAWGREHFRSFPWRVTEDPYRILMAEVMLHRTQASQVVPVYELFLEQYPDVPSLASATKEELYQGLYPLGLHWRIDLIHEMAAQLMEHFDACVPREKSDLLSLAGVGHYIAGAVRCFAWNIAEPLLDTNSVRVLGRLFGLETKDSSRRNQLFQELAALLVDIDAPRAYNYAILDLADKVCMKRQPPVCGCCPLSWRCVFAKQRDEENH